MRSKVARMLSQIGDVERPVDQQVAHVHTGRAPPRPFQFIAARLGGRQGKHRTLEALGQAARYRDNGDGTVTWSVLPTKDGLFSDRKTVPGSFPDEFVVVFKDHNYTPTKDGPPVGFTWHWDDIEILGGEGGRS